MSRTKRIYNSKHWKWHAEWDVRMRKTYPSTYSYSSDDTGGIYGWFFIYHPYHQTCMGRCRMCRNEKENGWRRKRYRLKYELRLEIQSLRSYPND
jgi:hypothetical protein